MESWAGPGNEATGDSLAGPVNEATGDSWAGPVNEATGDSLERIDVIVNKFLFNFIDEEIERYHKEIEDSIPAAQDTRDGKEPLLSRCVYCNSFPST